MKFSSLFLTAIVALAFTACDSTETIDCNANPNHPDCVEPPSGADLSVTVNLETDGPFTAGQDVEYSLAIVNNGPEAVTTIDVTDSPTNLTVSEVSGSGCDGLPCTIPGPLADGEETAISVVATIDAEGEFDYTASISSDIDDPDTANNSDSAGSQGEAETLEVQTISDVHADTSGTGRFALVDLESGDVILSPEDDDRSDSLSTSWDIGFNATTVIANTTAGSEGGITFVESLFEEVDEAPADGYAEMLPSGSGNGWYNYDPATHIVSPIPGRTVMVRTAEGNYAKVRILSYYKGNPASPAPGNPNHPSRFYSFEYVVQPDGTHDFPVE